MDCPTSVPTGETRIKEDHVIVASCSNSAKKVGGNVVLVVAAAQCSAWCSARVDALDVRVPDFDNRTRNGFAGIVGNL
tara:strand:+ start:63049 stop:63282 length:234 start_codon:yes stop_codon:yes gene_type:complete